MLKRQSKILFCSENKKTDAEVEVFTSDSLISLVKLMHPYCLKLHVEEGDRSLFSQEEVWRYEEPTEENDEEINVVSDDEAPVKDTKQEHGVEGRRDGCLPKSVLLNGNSSRVAPSRGRKRVSFGSVQVALFDESLEAGLNEKSLTCEQMDESDSGPLESKEALVNDAGSAPELSTPSSGMNPSKTNVGPEKSDRKTKSLSLQQYRQLRQERRPLVEKRRNYTTKWPSVSELPKELTPILCFQGQQHSVFKPKMTLFDPDLHRPDCKTSAHPIFSSQCLNPPEAGLPPHRHCSRLKHPWAGSKFFSPTSPLTDIAANPNATVPAGKKSATLHSSDPPNPVLVPLPAPQTPSPPTADSSSEARTGFANMTNIGEDESPETTPQRRAVLCNLNDNLMQEMKPEVTVIPPDVSSVFPAKTGSALENDKPQAPKLLTDELADVSLSEEPPPLLTGHGVQSAAVQSGKMSTLTRSHEGNKTGKVSFIH